MIWLRDKTRQIGPAALASLQRTVSHPQQQNEMPQDIYQHKLNWKITASMISVTIFLLLLCATLVGIPIALTYMKKEPSCPPTKPWSGFPDPMQLCTAKALWNPKGITVAGLASGLSSASLSGLQYPNDIYVYDNGTVLVADFMNNRVTKWDPNATVGVIIAGTGSYGSWSTLLARPAALDIRDDQLYVSDLDNYRIQIFSLDSNMSSPEGISLIGRYGQGSDLDQINQVTSIITPTTFPSFLYMSDSKNHRILLWDSEKNATTVVAGQSGISGSDITHLSNPLGITLDETINSLYIADTFNNRIQKYDMNERNPIITVAGWGELDNPHAVQLDPSGSNMFIADTFNHRILVWLNGASQGRTIAGNGSMGNSVYQLNNPSQIRFDSNYNLYVVDTNNSRIQRFDLISNGC